MINMRLKSHLIFLLLFVIPISTYASNIDANKLLFDSVNSEKLDVEGVKTALKEGADPNSIWERNNNLSVLSYLATGHGADKEKEKKCVEIAKLLFQQGAKLQNIYGDRVILYAPIVYGFYDFTELLLKNGASATEKIDGELPIEIAEKNGQSDIVDLFVKYGAKRVSKDKAIQLRFIECADDSDIPCMKKYLEEGADINGKDSRDVTALIAALRNPIYDIKQLLTIKYLLEQGANTNLKGESMFRGLAGIPLHVAIAMNQFTMKEENSLAEITIRALIDAGAYVSVRDESWKTPLHIAAENNNLRGAQLLIESEAKILDRDKNNRTPLDYAESAQMIQLLKKHGATLKPSQ